MKIHGGVPFYKDPDIEGEITVDYGNKTYDHYKKLGMFPKSRRQASVLVPESKKERSGCYYAVCTHNPLRCKECNHFGCEHDLEFLLEST